MMKTCPVMNAELAAVRNSSRGAISR